MTVAIRKSAFNPWREIEQYQQTIGKAGKYGATASFVGTMRDFNEGEKVSAMMLEYYPGMTEKHLEQITRDAFQRWDLIDVLVLHRVGEIRISEPIVLVVVWSSHRKEAFDACRFIMDDLKSRAPFWKQETLEQGKRWVEKNTPG